MEANARTVVSQLRFSKRNVLHFLWGAVAAQRLVVAIRVVKIVKQFPVNDVQQHGSFPDSQEPAEGPHMIKINGFQIQ
jgi:hypothetical protein